MRMRKTFLLLCLAFVLIAQNAMAEDVTSTYLSDPGFESCTASTSSFTADYAHGDYSESGWTAGSNDIYGRGGVLAYGSKLYCNTSSGAIPDVAWDSDASNLNALGMGCSWTSQLYYLSDTITLPAGLYTLSVHVYNANSGGTSVGSNLFGFVTTDGATSYYSSTTTFTAGEWTTISVSFLLTEETSGQVSVGYKSSGSGSDSNPVLYFDDITIDYSTEITDSYLTDPGFERCTAISSSADTGGSATSGSSYWTGTATSTATGAPVKYNSGLYVGASGGTVPESSWDESSDNTIAMGMNARWGTSNYVYYTSEEITLPAGTYAIAVHAYNANSSATSVGANYTGFVTSGNTTYCSTNTSFTTGEWIVDYVTFTLESATTGNIRVGYGGASGGAGSNPVIYVDDVTIYGPETTTGDEEEEDSLIYDISADVLSNGGFEDCEAITENCTSYVDYAEQGWAITRGDNTYGAVVAYGSSYTLNAFSAPSEAWDAEEATENKNALGISSGWSGNIYYDGDTLTLPAGTYRATIHSYNANSSATAWQSNLTGFVTTDGTTYYAERLSFVSNTWQTCTVEFTLDTAATGFFRVGGQGRQSGSSNSAAVFFDDYTVATDVPSALGYQRVAAEYDGKEGSITVSYSGGWNYTENATLSLTSGAVATVTDTIGTTTIGTATLTALEGDSIGFTADLSNIALSASTTYIISIPAEVYGYTGTSAMNQAIAYTLTTPTVSLGELTASLEDEAILNFDGTLTVLYDGAENNYPDGIYTLGIQSGASATLTAGETTVTGTITALGGDSVGYTVTFSDLSLTAGTTYTITIAEGAYGYGVDASNGYNAVLNEELSISFTEAIHVQEGQLYTFQQKASRLYMSVNESSSTKYGNIVLSESEYGFTLEEQEDIDSLRLKSESQEYICHYGSNTWTLGTTTYGNNKYGDGYLNIALVGMLVSNDTVYYELVRTYGTTEYILATDDTSSGSIVYDNKSYASVTDRGLWAISEFERTTVDVTVGTTGYATLYYSQYNLQVPDGLTAYTVEVDGNYAILTAISSGLIPAGTGVVLKASETPTESTTYSFIVSSDEANAITDNALVGTDVTEKIDEDGYEYYILSTDDEGTVGFYWQSGTSGAYVTNAAHKASLAVETTSSDDDDDSDDSSVKGLTIVFDDATGILSTAADEAQTIQGIYTLTGVKVADGSDVDALPAGIYIINGKKALIK